ncbi:hypothetical protein ACJIZ3_001624 [Penstemon smallii]|uniref:Uncharacterized protein n=1 Tax=Penstemon smallii TaxID=265156 RepID=A0ABD3U453_9LAMI
MKSGRDEEKMMGPMFPRLHVNDTDKGGPRAPPRNKMALYEQLSIPSQRFDHSNNTDAAKLVPPPLNQGGGSERGMFFSYQLPPRHQSEKQYYSPYNGTSTTQVEHKKKFDEDDFRVPIFNNSFPSQEYVKYTSDELAPSSKPSYFSQSLQFQKANETSMLKSSVGQEKENQKREKTISKTDDLCADPKSTSNGHNSAVLGENITTTDDINSPTSVRDLLFGDQNIVHDISNGTEDRSCGADSVSETSILDSISEQDAITPDDVVGIIGQKHFWKARRAISNQQRVFAVQVFELHRLIKVQRLIASSPNILLEHSAYLNKPIKSTPGKQLPFEFPVKATPNISKPKGDSEKPIHKKEERSAENTNFKSSVPSAQNEVPPPSSRQPLGGNSPATSISNDHNARPWFLNQPNGHQWLIPVMSPSEGLVYKPCAPYPTPGYGTAYGSPGSNPMPGNFLLPGYGQHPQQYHQLPTYPPAGPHGYYPPYGMPFMNAAAYSGSSVEQMNPPAQFSAGEANVSMHNKNLFTKPTHKKVQVPDAADDVEVQGSTASSPSEILVGGGTGNVLPLFPMSSTINSTENDPRPSEPEGPTRVIKVVPHNARSATESAARIFQFIQEERKQYD